MRRIAINRRIFRFIVITRARYSEGFNPFLKKIKEGERPAIRACFQCLSTVILRSHTALPMPLECGRRELRIQCQEATPVPERIETVEGVMNAPLIG